MKLAPKKVSRGTKTTPSTKGVVSMSGKAIKASGSEEALVAIGIKVKTARDIKGLSIREAAKEADVSEVWLSNLEKGKLKNASLKTLFDISGVLGLQFQIIL